MSQEFPIQGSDPRQNIDKPKETFQEAYDMETAQGMLRVLAVHVGEDRNSAVYFLGIPEAYKGGAVYREQLAPDFVGDPEAEAAPESQE